MEMDDVKPKGPFVVWEYACYEGWSHKSFNSLKEALEAEKYRSEWVITGGPIKYDVVQKDTTP